tara:strand:- start:314 stop:844 length:531 start_codon:yes stop_codon:yes gene_type:complete
MSRDGVSRSSKRIIRVTPTLLAEEHHDDDVLFTSVEIPRAVIEKGGSSKLLTGFLIDYGKESTDVDYNILFTQGNTVLGTRNATANITDADFAANKFCGICKVLGDTGVTYGIDGSNVLPFLPATGANENINDLTLLQAEKDSTSVFVHCVIFNVNSGTNPTYTANQLELVLHIED